MNQNLLTNARKYGESRVLVENMLNTIIKQSFSNALKDDTVSDGELWIILDEVSK